MSNMKKNTLHLTINRKWFDLIKDGTKREEYREIKVYWINRLLLDFVGTSMGGFASILEKNIGALKEFWSSKCIKTRPYTHVLFINGYGKNRPRIEKEIEGITIGKPKKGLCPDEFLDKEYFIIKFK